MKNKGFYLNELLGIKYPIIQGGMANIASGSFAAAVSNAGALGTIGSGAMNAAELEREINICMDATDKPFAVNIIMLNRHVDELVKVIAKYGIKYVTVGAGSPHAHMDFLREHGVSVMPLISAPVLAKRAETLDVLALIAEGTEAGGHIGEMTSMTLIPQTVSAVRVPVVAAGGIASGRQMLAAQALGACGVQIGTALLFTEECPVHENYKNMLIKSGASNVTAIGRKNGMPIRLIKNDMTREYHRQEAAGATLEELESYTLGALKRAVKEGDVTRGSVMAGFTVGQIDDIVPVSERIERIMREYEQAINEL